MQPEIQSEIVWLLQTITGQLRAAGELVEADRPTEVVIQQLEAVKAALRVVGNRLLICQLNQSEEIILNGSEEDRTAELSRLWDLEALYLQQQDHDMMIGE